MSRSFTSKGTSLNSQLIQQGRAAYRAGDFSAAAQMLGAAKTPDEIMGEADHLRGNALMHLGMYAEAAEPMPPPSTTVPTASAARCSPTAARRSPPWATTRRPLRLSLPLRRMLPMPRRSRPIWAWAMRCSSRATMPTREPPSVRLPSTAPIRLLPPHSASSVVASLSSAVRRMPWRLIARLSALPAPRRHACAQRRHGSGAFCRRPSLRRTRRL